MILKKRSTISDDSLFEKPSFSYTVATISCFVIHPPYVLSFIPSLAGKPLDDDLLQTVHVLVRQGILVGLEHDAERYAPHLLFERYRKPRPRLSGARPPIFPPPARRPGPHRARRKKSRAPRPGSGVWVDMYAPRVPARLSLSRSSSAAQTSSSALVGGPHALAERADPARPFRRRQRFPRPRRYRGKDSPTSPRGAGF